jgi:hypoxia up-regulated 1
MLLSHARDMTIAYGMENFNAKLMPKDLVLTVPSFSTQHERKALLDAAALAEFNVLALIDETTAAALHYGMDKIMEEPKILIFYNLGASSLQVSVVKFLSYPHKESKYAKEKIVGGLEVMGKAWDSTLGGLALDHRIVEYLADEFNKKWGGGDVRDFSRPMAKLRVQANKVKHVLSANTEFPIFIEALHDDTALHTRITRRILEDLCADLLERAVKPIQDALLRANVTLEEVDGIELIGGGMRVPKIQEYLQKFLGDTHELGLHINSDESMALGASFHGANISTAFKVRHVGMADINPFGVTIGLSELEEVAPVEGEEVWTKQATMFKSGGKVGVKKTIAFTHDQDVHCQVDYEEGGLLPPGTQ